MEKIETKLKKEGWKIEEFQPKGEKYPWSLKISKKLNTKGLHTDSVTEKVRQSGGSYVITAYLEVNKKLDIKTREERIKSAIRWELIKNYLLLSKYTWLDELQNIVGKVQPILLKKKVYKAVSTNSNEVALKEEKEAKLSHFEGEVKQTISARTVGKTALKRTKKASSVSSKDKIETTKKTKEATKPTPTKSKTVSTKVKKIVSTKRTPNSTKKTADTSKPKTVKKPSSQPSKKSVNSTPKSTVKQKKVTSKKKGIK